ncbi:MAG: NAD-glutamate dehydrogenase, partial [Actinomycetota bacterium]|nr:NAD-glutamate dehydrogenase [Actinomycetota bacterium]
MHISRLEDAKDQLIADALKIADQRKGGAAVDRRNVCDLLNLYYHHVAPEDILGRSAIDVYGAAINHYRLAKARPQGTAAVRVFTPSIDDNEWAAEGHSVIEIVTDDMPFLVDSVTMALSADDRSIYAVIHPQLLVRRDVTGQLHELCDGDSVGADLESDLLRESWMHIEIDRETDPGELERIEQTLLRGLRDVREAVEDWARMREQAREIVRDLESQPPPLPIAEVTEGRALLDWLADDHFTFLGYREYQLQTVEGEDVLRATPGTGLGILRADQDMSPSFGKLPPEARARARDKKLLIITKANSRSTVHRPAYLDYVGIKCFDESGEVCGERRFLGLFSSAAYTESLTRIPVLRDKA